MKRHLPAMRGLPMLVMSQAIVLSLGAADLWGLPTQASWEKGFLIEVKGRGLVAVPPTGLTVGRAEIAVIDPLPRLCLGSAAALCEKLARAIPSHPLKAVAVG